MTSECPLSALRLPLSGTDAPSLLGNPAALKLLRGLRLVRLLRLLKLLKLQQHIDTLEDYLEVDLGFLQVPLIATDCH